jgi:hypothetical protein
MNKGNDHIARMSALNTPWNMWQVLHPAVRDEDWVGAAAEAMHTLAGLPIGSAHRPLADLLEAILIERQFGPDHWTLSRSKRIYYNMVRPVLPASFRPLLRRLLLAPQKEQMPIDWPIEDRYVRFQFEMLRHLLENSGHDCATHVGLWPEAKRHALVLTHDVESARGYGFVREVMELEERYGFRSSFNFVPEDYHVEPSLIGEMRERGFEVGVHGLKHDGSLFQSRRGFQTRALKINDYLKQWDAVGFRAPFTHRNPDWMQALDIEYDCSFFDTDPFETIPGGTMSIWPFMIGHFVELPYTLPQDHTLIATLGESSPRLWLEKVEFIEEHCGLAMMITHPDYLRDPLYMRIYEEFLAAMRTRTGYWHALPRTVARWWRSRLASGRAASGESNWETRMPEGASIGTIRLAPPASPEGTRGRRISLSTDIVAAALQIVTVSLVSLFV